MSRLSSPQQLPAGRRPAVVASLAAACAIAFAASPAIAEPSTGIDPLASDDAATIVAQASTAPGPWAVPGAPPVNGRRGATGAAAPQPGRSTSPGTGPQAGAASPGMPVATNPTGSTAPDANATGPGSAEARGVDATRAGIAVPVQQSRGTMNAAPQAIVTPGTPLGAAPSDMTGWRRGISGGTNGPGIAPPPGAPDAITPPRAGPLVPAAPGRSGR